MLCRPPNFGRRPSSRECRATGRRCANRECHAARRHCANRECRTARRRCGSRECYAARRRCANRECYAARRRRGSRQCRATRRRRGSRGTWPVHCRVTASRRTRCPGRRRQQMCADRRAPRAQSHRRRCAPTAAVAVGADDHARCRGSGRDGLDRGSVIWIEDQRSAISDRVSAQVSAQVAGHGVADDAP